MQVLSSITTTALDPSIEPAWAQASLVMGRSMWSAGTNQGAEAPPGIHAFSFAVVAHPPRHFVDQLRQVGP